MYYIQKLKSKKWIDYKSFKTYKEAKKGCISLCGDDYDCDSFRETKWIIPQAPFVWNGMEYQNPLSGKIKKMVELVLFSFEEGYFGNNGADVWLCRIYKK